MEELIAAIRVAIDEDERVALAAADYGQSWRAADSGIYPSDGSRHPGPIIAGVYGDLEEQYAVHIARHDPVRVQRQVAAHRKILELHQVDYTAPAFNVYGLRVRDGWVCSVCSERVDGEPQRSDGPACPTVVLLAEAYGIEVDQGRVTRIVSRDQHIP